MRGTIFNFGEGIAINLCEPELIKEFMLEKYIDFKKSNFFLDSFIDIIGVGLPFAEGEEWK